MAMLTVFIVLTTGMSMSFIPISEGQLLPDVQPMDIVAHVGDDIAINCTFPETSGSIPALYIKKESSSRILCDSHHLVAANTWQLRLSNVDSRDSGRYWCYSVPLEYTCEELNNQNLTDQDRAKWTPFSCLVQIGEPPRPVNFSAVMDDFDTMKVDWCDGTDPGVPNYTLYWTVMGVPEHKNGECSNYGMEKCSCYLSDAQTMAYETYNFTLKAKNDHGTRYFTWTVATDASIARAGPVQNVVSNSSANELHIDWDQPLGLRAYYEWKGPEKYVVNISGEWGDFDKTFNVNESHLTVDNLESYTMYNISIQAVIQGSQYPGNIISRETRTAQAVPSQGPLVVAHREVPCDDGGLECRNIVLYWQDIPLRYENGPVTDIEISYEANREPVPLSPAYSYEWKDLHQMQSYNFSVRDKNSVGWSPRTYYEVPDLSSSAPIVSDVFIEYWEDNGSLQLHYQPPEDNIDQFILFSCDLDVSTKHRCLSSPSVQMLPANTSQVALNLSGDARVYGLMAVTGGVASSLGPHWICNYRSNGEPSEPVVSPTDAGQSEVTLNLDLPPCQERQPTTAPGRVVSYFVQYGIQECTNDGKSLILPGTTTRHRLTELTPGQTYSVCVTAIGHSANTSAPEVTFNTLKKDYTTAIVTPTILLALLLAILLTLYIGRHHIKPWIKRLQIRVTLPATPDLMVPNLESGYETTNSCNGFINSYTGISPPLDRQQKTSVSSSGQRSDSALGSSSENKTSGTESREYFDIDDSSGQKPGVKPAAGSSKHPQINSSGRGSWRSSSVDTDTSEDGVSSSEEDEDEDEDDYCGGQVMSGDKSCQTQLLQRSPEKNVLSLAACGNVPAELILENEVKPCLPCQSKPDTEPSSLQSDGDDSSEDSYFGTVPMSVQNNTDQVSLLNQTNTVAPVHSNDCPAVIPCSNFNPISSPHPLAANNPSNSSLPDDDDDDSILYHGTVENSLVDPVCNSVQDPPLDTIEPDSSSILYHDTVCVDGSSSGGSLLPPSDDTDTDTSSGLYHKTVCADDTRQCDSPQTNSKQPSSHAADLGSPRIPHDSGNSSTSDAVPSDTEYEDSIYHGTVSKDAPSKPVDSGLSSSQSSINSDADNSLVFSSSAGYYVPVTESKA